MKRLHYSRMQRTNIGQRMLLAAMLALFAGQLSAKITYTVSFPRRSEHYANVKLEIDGLRRKEYLDVSMPAWAPGSYRIRDFARNVVSLEAWDARKELTVEKIDKDTWRIPLNGQRRVNITYQVYAFESTVRTSYIDHEQAMLNGSSIYLYPEGMEDRELLLVINKPTGWPRVTCSLELVGGDSPVFRVENYDQLIDAPVMIGRHAERKFTSDGVEYTVAISGTAEFDRGQLISDTRAIANSINAMFGTPPFSNFVIFLDLKEHVSGALEHLNSTHILKDRWDIATPAGYHDYLGTLAHEMFHAYNVKRIRPVGLGPFNYSAETYTDLLWVAEGLTSYYDNQLLLRTGLIDSESYLEAIAGDIKILEGKRGRYMQTLEESSFDAWIKFYRPDENSDNATISYYNKGSLVGLALDVAILEATRGARRLDDVFALLWADYKATGDGFTSDEFKALVDSVAGRPLDEIFLYTSTTTEMDWGKILEPVGLELQTYYADPGDSSAAYWGFTGGEREHHYLISKIIAGTPAAISGLSAGDELVAVDGLRVTDRSAKTLLATRDLDKMATFLVARAGAIHTFKIKPVAAPHNQYRLLPVAEISDDQQDIQDIWLNTAQE
ncbi:M61 family metallopeptidase [Candidatus Neomarinimicrobiota bacterium]